jgi:phenylacetate-CoA ligase
MKIYNTFLEKYLLPIGDFFLGSCYMKELQKWRKICQLSEQEIQSLGDANLRNILDYSIKSIPFYSNLGIISHSDLKKYISQFPIMTKKDIKENLDTLLVSDNKGLIAVSSSGSSGIQGTVYIDKREQSISRAIQTLWWEWSGYYVGKKILQTGLVLKRGFVKKMKDIVFRVKYTSAFTSSEQEIIRILAPLKNKCGWFLGGYPSSLNIFANITKKKEYSNLF